MKQALSRGLARCGDMLGAIGRLARLLPAVLVILVFGSAAALADHMNGQYSGTGDAAGTNLALQQSGRSVTGQLTGATQGTLSGQSDGGDNASGTVEITGVGQLQFQLRWSQAGLNLTLQGQGGTENYTFTRGGGISQNPPPPDTTPQPPPVTPAATAEYYVVQNGQQIGPVTREQIVEALTAGQIGPNDLVWKDGLPNWVAIGTLPELAPPTRNGPPPLPPTNGPPPLPGPVSDGGPGPPGPGQLTEAQRKISAIMLGSTLGILAHELGHALIGEFQLPATGAEEDTADEFSALIMASMLQDTTGMQAGVPEFLREVIGYSTLLWFHDAVQSQRKGVSLPWYDEHAASETRFRNTLCMIYGSSPAQFAFLADRVELPERERGRCEIDHAKRYRAWEMIVQPYARNQGGEYPGHRPADEPGASVKVSYQRSATAFGQSLEAEFRNLGLFEGLATGLEGLLVWNRDLNIIFADCGVANAFYDPSRAQIVMCWEGIEHFFWIVAEPEGVPRTQS